MKKIFVILFLAALVPLNAQAGKVIIRETETAIYVEYTGDTEAMTAAEIKPVEAPVVPSAAPLQVDGEEGEEQISERSKKKAERAAARTIARDSKRTLRTAQGTQQEQ